MLSREATNTSVIVFGVTRSWLESTIYPHLRRRTRYIYCNIDLWSDSMYCGWKFVNFRVQVQGLIINSNMTSFFRFVNKRAIYRLGIISLAHAPMHVTDFPVVNVNVDELSSARIWQHKLCATLSANVNINYRFPIKVYYCICTYQNRNKSWKPEWNSKHILASMIYFLNEYVILGSLGLWCLTPLSTIFQLYYGSVLLVEETGVPGEKHWPVASHWQSLSHNVVSEYSSPERDSNSQR
jgi:hypothetical protein